MLNVFQGKSINFNASKSGKKTWLWLSSCIFCLFFRRDIKQVDSHPFSSPLFTSRKRVALPESTKTTPDENFNKKSKVISHSDSSEVLQSETSVQKDSVLQKRKNRDSGTEKTNVSGNNAQFFVNYDQTHSLVQINNWNI